jgi:hypothetical protein
MILTEKLGKLLDRLRFKKRAYQLTFGTQASQVVMDDLVKFCHGNMTCFDADPRVHAAFEGRREVLLRICQMLNMSSETLFTTYYGRQSHLEHDDA